MNVPTRLGLFTAAVLLSFGGAFAIGATIGPDLSGVDPAPHGMQDEGGMSHGES
ncbi:hypothetical protein BH23ACT9_BH23ACT9_39560 [soil metagenome]